MRWRDEWHCLRCVCISLIRMAAKTVVSIRRHLCHRLVSPFFNCSVLGVIKLITSMAQLAIAHAICSTTDSKWNFSFNHHRIKCRGAVKTTMIILKPIEAHRTLPATHTLREDRTDTKHLTMRRHTHTHTHHASEEYPFLIRNAYFSNALKIYRARRATLTLPF